MTDQPLLVRPGRSPWQWFYGAAHRWRRSWYSRRQATLPRPVISVGNLHWGGSGKTPVTAALARHLIDDGRRVAILSRGYGRKDRKVRLVSSGEGPLIGPSLAGDEPVLLAGEVPGAAVVVAPERHLAGRHAMERLDPPPELFILDDGFSHLGLARDLDLLVFPADDPLGGGRLWPGGRLREPLDSARHADAILVNGSAADAQALASALEPYGLTGPAFACDRRVETPRLITGGPIDAGRRTLLVSAIARPGDFETTAGTLDVEVVDVITFPDHHDYPDTSLRQIESAFDASGAEVVLTTSKDRVKLLGRLDRPLAEVPLSAAPANDFWRWFDGRISELAPR